jgi:hypothetical protein
MKTPAKNNALSFVGQIKTAYKAVLKAEGEALKYAIVCGEALNRAKENIESTKPKGKWKDWLAEHCSEINPRTERLYRQLAEAVAKNPDIFADCESIRDAVKKVQGNDDEEEENSDSNDESEDSEDEEDEESGNALPQWTGTKDLTDLMKVSEVDEIGIALNDADKFEEVAKASIVKLSPDKVCDALTQAWR